jgi:hypothetical protein
MRFRIVITGQTCGAHQLTIVLIPKLRTKSVGPSDEGFFFLVFFFGFFFWLSSYSSSRSILSFNHKVDHQAVYQVQSFVGPRDAGPSKSRRIGILSLGSRLRPLKYQLVNISVDGTAHHSHNLPKYTAAWQRQSIVQQRRTSTKNQDSINSSG